MVLVSIIIPTKDRLALLKECIHTITSFTEEINYEVILVDNGSTEPGVETYYRGLGSKYRIVPCPPTFNFSQLCNAGANSAQGTYLLFLNNDTQVTKDWLGEMLRLYEEKEFVEPVGTVGAKLLFPDGKIQHIGQIFRYQDKVPTHLYYGRESSDPKVMEMATKVRRVTGNTAACLLVRKNRFFEVGGFDIKYQNGFEDMDLNCKLTEKNYNHYYCPTAVVYHIEHGTLSKDPERDGKNLNYFFSKWANKLRRVEKG